MLDVTALSVARVQIAYSQAVGTALKGSQERRLKSTNPTPRWWRLWPSSEANVVDTYLQPHRQGASRAGSYRRREAVPRSPGQVDQAPRRNRRHNEDAVAKWSPARSSRRSTRRASVSKPLSPERYVPSAASPRETAGFPRDPQLPSVDDDSEYLPAAVLFGKAESEEKYMSERGLQDAIVTGAGSGIGRAIAHRLAEDGFFVIVADRAEAPAEETVDQIVSRGFKHAPKFSISPTRSPHRR